MDESKKKRLLAYWVKGSNLDFLAATDISLHTKSYVQALFFLHLSIEKALKALYVNEFSEHAPFCHGLLYLTAECKLKLDDKKQEVLADINEFNLETRYPDEEFELNKKATKNFTQKYINNGEDIRQWILEKLKD
ncbi:MAG: HEPN domain-containing protein [Bacteriovoracaceae bacterium]|nr:HEPN domain-containing protein [Bacteriovoracaceae bacterium]